MSASTVYFVPTTSYIAITSCGWPWLPNEDPAVPDRAVRGVGHRHRETGRHRGGWYLRLHAAS